MDVLAKDSGKIYRFLRNFCVWRLILANDNLLLIGPPMIRDMQDVLCLHGLCIISFTNCCKLPDCICVSFSWNERCCVNSSADFFCYNNVINKSSYNRVLYLVFCLKEGFLRLVYSVLINRTCATRVAAPLKKLMIRLSQRTTTISRFEVLLSPL